MSTRPTLTLGLCLAGGLAAGLALARPATDATPPAATPVVEAADGPSAAAQSTISDFAFGPITAQAGQQVNVANLDGAIHTATSSDGLFDTGQIVGNGSGSFVAPAEPGTYALFCAIHPSMQGQLTVTP